MNSTAQKTLDRWAPELDGVFALSDLRVIFRELGEAAVYKRAQRLVEAEELVKVKRGLYAVPSASLVTISHRINPNAYISLGTVLAEGMAIGSVPARRVQAVKLGRPRTFACALGTIEHLSIDPRLFFGFESKAGIRYASLEKAYLDACYFAFKGKSLSFDLDTDVDRNVLNLLQIETWLESYDPRFRDWVFRLWERTS